MLYANITTMLLKKLSNRVIGQKILENNKKVR